MSGPAGEGTGTPPAGQQGDPGTPNGDPAPNGQPPATPPAGQPNGQPAGNEGDGTDWRKHSRTWETRANQHKTAAEQAEARAKAAEERTAAILKAAGVGNDEDPAEAMKRAATERDTAAQERDQAKAEAELLRLERRAERLARKAGADVDLLLDSKAFETGLRGIKPDSASLEDDLKKLIEETLKDNPRLKATPPGPPASGREPSGGTTPPADIAPGLDRMRYALSTTKPAK
jgi:hypothetical protein